MSVEPPNTGKQVSSPRRHPTHGGYPNGVETRIRLIKTAISVFSRSGFKQASTREIAAEACVKTPALQYYFDNKVGLHYACVDFVTTTISNRLRPLLDESESRLAGGATRDQIVAQVCLIQCSMLDSFFDKWEGASMWYLLDGDEKVEETQPARLLVRERIDLPFFKTMSLLIGAVIGRAATDLETKILVTSVYGVVAVFQLDRNRIAAYFDWEEYGAAYIEPLKSIICEQTSMLLRGLVRVRSGRGI